MQIREFPNSGLKVSPVGIGCMSMAGAYGPVDEAEAVATIHRAVELGVTMIDTADFYGPGTSEAIVGRALAGMVRADVLVATKTGMRRGPSGPPTVDGSPEYITEACDLSLERLGIDTIDLYFLARVDAKVAIEESVGAMADLVKVGKVANIGLCEASPATIRRAHDVHPIAALQTEYSLWERHVEADVLPTVRELGLGFVGYRPLGSGFLGGGFAAPDFPQGDFRRNDPRFQADNFEHNRRLLANLQKMAAEKSVTPAQLAIAWVMSQGDFIVPIPGTSKRTHLEENVAAVDLFLSPSDLKQLDALFPPGSAAGSRYPEPLMRVLDAS